MVPHPDHGVKIDRTAPVIAVTTPPSSRIVPRGHLRNGSPTATRTSDPVADPVARGCFRLDPMTATSGPARIAARPRANARRNVGQRADLDHMATARLKGHGVDLDSSATARRSVGQRVDLDSSATARRKARAVDLDREEPRGVALSMRGRTTTAATSGQRARDDLRGMIAATTIGATMGRPVVVAVVSDGLLWLGGGCQSPVRLNRPAR